MASGINFKNSWNSKDLSWISKSLFKVKGSKNEINLSLDHQSLDGLEEIVLGYNPVDQINGFFSDSLVLVGEELEDIV
ncbi:hypothetical protein WICPIJ_002637 [Wickerhamomyces pijperi]|uniref:Uncharacterized protein n=1 Tax=Wickerhamomyces pijperi TaxID=599730 RepID=A0A9P8QBF6_WICPI|nr:hypothetical protein WICPIJ_002637 [Wickerhamomyces pijperi]